MVLVSFFEFSLCMCIIVVNFKHIWYAGYCIAYPFVIKWKDHIYQ